MRAASGSECTRVAYCSPSMEAMTSVSRAGITASTPSTWRSAAMSSSVRPRVESTRMSMSDVPSKYSSAASFISGAVMRRPA